MSWIAGGLAVALLATGVVTPAQAQFNWFGFSEASPQDVSDTIAEHGFRLIGPLYRTGRVYVADVVDRRNRRERLIVSAENGQIVQRFFVDTGGADRRQGLAERPRPPRDDSFFARLQRGWDDDEPPPRPPLSLPAQPGAAFARPGPDGDQVVVPRARPRSEPRVVTRTDTAPVTAPLPVTAAPLAPAPGPSSAPGGTKPDTPAAAPTASQPTGTGRATTIVNDPLRIPGTRKPDSAKPSPAPTAVATVKPADPTAKPEAPPAVKPETPPAAKPAPAKPADVPVAPLD